MFKFKKKTSTYLLAHWSYWSRVQTVVELTRFENVVALKITNFRDIETDARWPVFDEILWKKHWKFIHSVRSVRVVVHHLGQQRMAIARSHCRTEDAHQHVCTERNYLFIFISWFDFASKVMHNCENFFTDCWFLRCYPRSLLRPHSFRTRIDDCRSDSDQFHISQIVIIAKEWTVRNKRQKRGAHLVKSSAPVSWPSVGHPACLWSSPWAAYQGRKPIGWRHRRIHWKLHLESPHHQPHNARMQYFEQNRVCWYLRLVLKIIPKWESCFLRTEWEKANRR